MSQLAKASAVEAIAAAWLALLTMRRTGADM